MYDFSNLDFEEMDRMLLYIKEKGAIDIYDSPIPGLYLDEIKNYVEFFDLFNPPIFTKRDNLLIANTRTFGFIEEGGVLAHIETMGSVKDPDPWKEEWDKVMGCQGSGMKLEKEKEYEKAIQQYERAVRFGESSTRLNINNFCHSIDRLIILYAKLKKEKLLENFLKEKIDRYPEHSLKWKIRLNKLSNKIKQEPNFNIEDLKGIDRVEDPLGVKYNQLKLKLPEFDFYYKGYDNDYYKKQDRDILTSFELDNLNKCRKSLMYFKDKAKESESVGDYKTAIIAYEEFIMHQFQDPEPYERLMVIYKKFGFHEQYVFTLNKAYFFFKKAEIEQRNYIIKIANKYGMMEKAMEYLNAGKKIFYYNGAFELYNPNTSRLNKWAELLAKLGINTNQLNN